MIKQLSLSCFRSFSNHSIDFSPGLNVLIGENGSGKTSVLEAIYLFAYSRSFRAHRLAHILQHGNERAAAFVRLIDDQTFGWGYSSTQSVQYQSNHETVSVQALLAAFPPCLFIDSSSHRVFTKQSIYRRQLLDWGVYHSNDDFGSTWNMYQRALKQRNAALKQGRPIQFIRQWDDVLIQYGESIKAMRQHYVGSLKQCFDEVINETKLKSLKPVLKLSHGWTGSLGDALRDTIEDDYRYKYTTSGPHRGRIDIQLAGGSAKDYASEGQQKTLHYTLRLAQAKYLKQHLDKRIVFLIDDLNAELDDTNQHGLLSLYQSIDAQLIITAINMPKWSSKIDQIHQLNLEPI